MRNLISLPAIVVSSVLVAQAPQPAPAPSLAEQYNRQAEAVTKLLNEHKLSEAMTLAKAALPSNPPVIDSKNPGAIVASLENAKGYLALLQLQAIVTREHGQWEKALEIQQQRLDLAKGFRADLAKAIDGLDKDWSKIVAEGNEYMATNKPVAEGLTKSIEVLSADLKAYNEHKVKLDKKQFEELKARAAQGNKDQETLNEIQNKIQGFQGAMANQKKFAAWANNLRPEGDSMVKAAETAMEGNQTTLKSLATESNDWVIKQNAKKGKKKVTVADWVDAVMRDHTNLTKLDSSRVQVAYLNRLLVMAPGNKMASSALANILANKDPFAVEKGGKGRKKK